MSEPSRKLVVAGLISNGSQRVLITQRPTGKAHPLAWEFPGGKIERGESPVEALKRELREEIGVRVHIGPIWEALHHDYRTFEVIMLVYPCLLAPGEQAKCLEVHDLSWCTPAQLDDYPILPADRPLIERLKREGVPNGLGAAATTSEC